MPLHLEFALGYQATGVGPSQRDELKKKMPDIGSLVALNRSI